MSAHSVKRFPRFAPAAAEIPPGPNAGRVWRDAPLTHCDPVTGRIVTRLTNYRGHSHHLVGPAPCWLDGGRQLVLVSDREGYGNLFIHDFADATLTQLTDLRGEERPSGAYFTGPTKLGFWYGPVFYEVELDSLRMREARSRPVPRPRVATSGRVGETISPALGRMVWFAEDAAANRRRALAVTGGSGRASFALTAPCLRPGRAQVVFVSDASDYAQLYLVDVGPVAELPLLTTLVRARR